MRGGVILILAAIISACSATPKYPGFREVEPGLYFQLVSFDAEGSRDSDSVVSFYEVSFLIFGKDTLVQTPHDNIPGWMSVESDDHRLLQPYLKYLNPGDSAIFLQEQSSSNADSLIEVRISLRNSYSQEKFARVYDAWLTQREMNEQERIKQYLETGGFIPSLVQPAIWYRVDVTGKGDPISFGDPVVISFQGAFLTEQKINANADTLDFILGTEGQIIDGLTYGLIGALPGQKRTIVIPSQYAFGDKGSSTVIVPPYSPLVYEVVIADTAQKDAAISLSSIN
jgi:FKBP-type peptidyl-prolyl cis-trans isomerase